jgi:transcriptional regulator with XRE-family HTH domain
MGFKEIGRKIQQAREEKGLTQVELAQALGVTQAGLSNYELGKRRLYLNQIERIARILEKDIAFFIGGTNGAWNMDRTESPLKDAVLARISDLDESDLHDLIDYLDFLSWRKRRD